MNDSSGAPADGDSGAVYEEVIYARGHENVTGDHSSTVEVTTDDWLTPAGDCIVGVDADRTPAVFDEAFVSACQSADATITAEFEVETDGETLTDTITGRGDPELTFEGDRSLVGRTSDYVDDRTVFVGADGAATDVDRALVDALAAGAELALTLRVDTGER